MTWKGRPDELMAAQRERSAAIPPDVTAVDADIDEDEETPCDPTRPCRATYEGDDDLCCAHDGLCQDRAHPHFDPAAHVDSIFDEHLAHPWTRTRRPQHGSLSGHHAESTAPFTASHQHERSLGDARPPTQGGAA
jgi:hypothetical protein